MSRRGRSKNRKKEKSEKWYYDASSLLHENAYDEIINQTPPRKSVVSHLALGETYARLHNEKKTGAAEAFAQLIEKAGRFIEIQHHQGIDKIFKQVRSEFPALSLTDAIHLSTAIRNSCCILKSEDRDLCGLSPKRLKNFIVSTSNLKSFAILKVRGRR